MDDYLIQYSEVEDLSIGELLEKIDSLNGKRLCDMKLSDLAYFNNSHIKPGSGVYIFRNNKKYIYVGKCRSMSFTERIGNHFDTRPEAWMNSMLKGLMAKGQSIGIQPSSLEEASEIAFRQFNLIMINFDRWERIDITETMFRAYTSPLNKFKRKREHNKQLKVRDY